jgi:alkanesulfonate monooxygenase SsuD/methylene tetrahydromethanopterin reductase-like flavin-dependent oxidoreductase (luciferase family)
MATTQGPRIGVMFNRNLPPEQLVPYARALEAYGAADVWLVEDLTWAGAMSSAATALAATERLRVGISLCPAPLRNPALLAMELGTLARLYPGRLAAGIGHGVKEWMEQIGAWSASPMALLEETAQVLHAMLRGGEATVHGRQVHVDGVALVHPPAEAPPVLIGGVGPRTLALAGRVADGSILIEGLDPARLAAARALVDQGRAQRAQDGPHEVVALVFAHVTDDVEAAAKITGPMAETASGLLGITDAEVYFALGTAAEVAGQLRVLHEAGADTVALHIVGDDKLAQAEAILGEFARD